MELVRKLLLKLSRGDEGNDGKQEEHKDNDDPGNVAYETFEHGYKYPEVEVGCGINLMKHRNEL